MADGESKFSPTENVLQQVTSDSLERKLASSLTISYFNFVLLAQEDILMPSYKGAALRGGFGYILRKISCIKKNIISCEECEFHQTTSNSNCLYSYLFQTHNSPSIYNKMKNVTDIPRPFVIEPPTDTKTIYRKGEKFQIGFLLFGNAIKYYPHIIFAIEELGKNGIGKWRSKYSIHQITNYRDENVYDIKDKTITKNDTLTHIPLREIINNHSQKSANNLTIKLLTPLRIKNNSQLIGNPPTFRILISAILHRISSISYFHCNSELILDYKSLLAHAQYIKTSNSDLKWQDWERYSTRQKSRMKLGGLIGNITYEGEITPYLPLITAGQYTHIGKNCTFGLGKYEILTR